MIVSAPIDPIVAFRAVCMKGEARFANGSVRSVRMADLPSEVHRNYRPNAQAKIYLGEGRSGYVVIAAESNERKDGSKRCEVFATKLEEKRLEELGFNVGPPNPSPRAIRNINSSYDVTSDLGYVLKAVKTGSDGIIIRSIALTPAQSERRQIDYKTVSDPAASEKERRAAARRLAEEGN